MMLSIQDVEALVGGTATEPGGDSLVSAALEEKRVDARIAKARRDIGQGKFVALDDAFFEKLRTHIRRRG